MQLIARVVQCSSSLDADNDVATRAAERCQSADDSADDALPAPS